MTPYISDDGVDLGYVFFEDYVDLCHPNHPDCVTGVTCDDCNDGFNPVLDVACNLVVFTDSPVITGINKPGQPYAGIYVNPNPSTGKVEITATGIPAGPSNRICVYSFTGVMIGQYTWDGQSEKLDLSNLPKGIYILAIVTPNGTEMKKLILQ